MTGRKDLFASMSSVQDGGAVTIGDDNKCKVIGVGTIGKSPNTMLRNLNCVEGLTHNLLSVGQLCNIGYRFVFYNSEVNIVKDNIILFKGTSLNNIYTINLSISNNLKCLVVSQEACWMCHRRLGHIHFDLITKLNRKQLVRGLPLIKCEKDRICDACQHGKQSKCSFPLKKEVSTSRPLELLHLDLFGPTQVASLGGMRYFFVIVDDYSRYTWGLFLDTKI